MVESVSEISETAVVPVRVYGLRDYRGRELVMIFQKKKRVTRMEGTNGPDCVENLRLVDGGLANSSLRRVLVIRLTRHARCHT